MKYESASKLKKALSITKRRRQISGKEQLKSNHKHKESELTKRAILSVLVNFMVGEAGQRSAQMLYLETYLQNLLVDGFTHNSRAFISLVLGRICKPSAGCLKLDCRI
jgi:hypothetical protein